VAALEGQWVAHGTIFPGCYYLMVHLQLCCCCLEGQNVARSRLESRSFESLPWEHTQKGKKEKKASIEANGMRVERDIIMLTSLSEHIAVDRHHQPSAVQSSASVIVVDVM
jgi:hypothetical protein